ncbi:MAG: hypothetical protein EOR08_27965 [Mesorhizobium sp.]|nr:MAG: hypothetical protein EOR08_27965 [Mesorhizobium sp.]
MPAGILSPYRDGERGAVIDSFANHQRLEERRRHCGQPLLPVTIRGEVPGRAMRGGAEVDHDINKPGQPLPLVFAVGGWQ